MNNSVKNYRGKVIGFKCSYCGLIKDKMWSNICNECRNKRDYSEKILNSFKDLVYLLNK